MPTLAAWGFAMLMLIVASGRLQGAGYLPRPTQNGVLFWSAIYIPIVVAMAASQNVRAAITGGPRCHPRGCFSRRRQFRNGSRDQPARAVSFMRGVVSQRRERISRRGRELTELWQAVESVLAKYSLVTAFAFVGLVVWVSYAISKRLTKGRMHGSAIAILMGLLLAYVGGTATGGTKGIADIECLAGIGVMGGAMLRDLAIVGHGVRRATGMSSQRLGRVVSSSLLAGVLVSFFVGAAVAYAFGYRDAVSNDHHRRRCSDVHRRSGGQGPHLEASSEVIALSVAAGLMKSILVMTLTPLVAKWIGLDNPRLGADLWWGDGNDQRRRRRARRNRRAACTLRRDDRDVLHGTRLPARAVSGLCGDQSSCRIGARQS